jgi:hypothetical protein
MTKQFYYCVSTLKVKSFSSSFHRVSSLNSCSTFQFFDQLRTLSNNECIDFDLPFQQKDFIVQVTLRKSTPGKDEVQLVLVELRLLHVNERADLGGPVRQKVALCDGERALEDPFRFWQVCS